MNTLCFSDCIYGCLKVSRQSNRSNTLSSHMCWRKLYCTTEVQFAVSGLAIKLFVCMVLLLVHKNQICCFDYGLGSSLYSIEMETTNSTFVEYYFIVLFRKFVTWHSQKTNAHQWCFVISNICHHL